MQGTRGPLVYHVSAYGADPTGQNDSTDPILRAITDALSGPGRGFLYEGIVNLGGARIDLDGGNYLISRPLLFPVAGKGNLVVIFAFFLFSFTNIKFQFTVFGPLLFFSKKKTELNYLIMSCD